MLLVGFAYCVASCIVSFFVLLVAMSVVVLCFAMLCCVVYVLFSSLSQRAVFPTQDLLLANAQV